jgi:hypothetical protein
LLKSIFRIAVAPAPSPEPLPDIAGRYLLSDQEVEFIPYFPLERGLQYRLSFNPQPLGLALTAEPFDLEFLIPREHKSPALTEVTHIFPSGDLLPENLLRFYVCFSNSMQRGRALEEVSLRDGDGRPVADALYRPPVELWDRTMRHLTVLLDPGRLKRWVGPNVKLGPPLQAGQQYILEIGRGMTDLYGRPLLAPFGKRFLVGNALRKQIAMDSWKILPPLAGSREALVLLFPRPLDWALLLTTITIALADGSVIDGQVVVDRCETRWSFTPSSPWIAGVYHIRARSSLEDVCGNSMTAAFDRPLLELPPAATEISRSALTFQLM